MAITTDEILRDTVIGNPDIHFLDTTAPDVVRVVEMSMNPSHRMILADAGKTTEDVMAVTTDEILGNNWTPGFNVKKRSLNSEKSSEIKKLTGKLLAMPPFFSPSPQQYITAVETLSSNDLSPEKTANFRDCGLTDRHVFLIGEILRLTKEKNQNLTLKLTGEQNFNADMASEILDRALSANPFALHELQLPHFMRNTSLVENFSETHYHNGQTKFVSTEIPLMPLDYDSDYDLKDNEPGNSLNNSEYNLIKPNRFSPNNLE